MGIARVLEYQVESAIYGPRLVILCGLEGETVAGKYIVGTRAGGDGETGVFAFDPSCALHRDIAGRFGIRVSGGGWMEWDSESSHIRLSGASTEFGTDPDRVASRAFLRVLFPEWTVL